MKYFVMVQESSVPLLYKYHPCWRESQLSAHRLVCRSHSHPVALRSCWSNYPAKRCWFFRCADSHVGLH